MKSIIFKTGILLVSLVLMNIGGMAREILDGPGKSRPQIDQNDLDKTESGCAQASAFTDLDINNVRARIMNGGDMWWDPGPAVARYEVPKGSLKNSLFAGSVWIGGYDDGGNLLVAAQTYRQNGGNDYWPGPLDSNASVSSDICTRWDKIWKVNLTDILDFLETDTSGNLNIFDTQWDDIREWPAYRNPYLTASDFAGKGIKDFAPFVDVNSDGVYDPSKGDYPDIKGDQYLYWIFNDAGNNKTETSTPNIGMEVQASAFAFLTNDELNNATFYKYTLTNRSGGTLDSCYISTWTDADLGYAFDDYVGCDTVRSLGILYNGDAFDGNGQPAEYGSDIPMVGVDFFEGPKTMRFNPDSGREVLTELGMTAFTFYNNTQTGQLRNPDVGIEFYRYMSGTNADGGAFTQTCTAADPSSLLSKTVYWGDPTGSADVLTNWNECGCGNPPDDRRFIHSSGPFTLSSGEDPIDVTIGAIWADGFDYPCPSFSKLQLADDKAQELFDRDFIPITPPNAPILSIRELDEKLVLYLNNPPGSNNENESYGEVFKEVSTKGIKLDYTEEECLYKFEGYKIFQVRDSFVTTGDIYNEDGTVNTDVARLAFQCDKQNDITIISNYVVDPSSPSSPPSFDRQVRVDGENKGIRKSFVVTKDLFSTGLTDKLVNYKRYYYIAVAYAYNQFSPFNPATPDKGQDLEYLESFKNGYQRAVRAVQGIPNGAYTDMGNQIRADYGDGVRIRLLEGYGNGGNFQILEKQSENEALANGQASEVWYEAGNGPVDVQIVDPVKLASADFELWLTGYSHAGDDLDTARGLIADSSSWFVVNLSTGDTIYSETNNNVVSDQILADYGLSIRLNQVKRVADDYNNMGLIGDTVIFDSPNMQWLGGVQDGEGRRIDNWIRAGADRSDPIMLPVICEYRDFMVRIPKTAPEPDLYIPLDPYAQFEGIFKGTWSPYYLAANDMKDACGFGVSYSTNDYTISTGANGWSGGYYIALNDLARKGYAQATGLHPAKLRGIDVVFTADRSKWSKCAVIEMRAPAKRGSGTGLPEETYAEGGANKFDLRRHPSLQRDPDGDGMPVYDNSDYGTSWFPGYAINVETGERLNILFGEDSYQPSNNGRDMMWNPTSSRTNGRGSYNAQQADFEAEFGGKHVIYVSNTKYDECNDIVAKLKVAESKPTAVAQVEKREVYWDMLWTGIPLVNDGYELTSWADGLIPTETRVRIRTQLPYQKYTGNPAYEIKNNGLPRYFFSTKDQTMVKWAGASDEEKDALLDRIRVVPNPYYAYSAYEWNRFDNRVKIINLPNRATVKIFSLDGVLIRTLTKDDQTAFLDWDLKNNAGILVSGGSYLMHVEAEGIGETVLKWFGAVRPIDITTF